VPFAERDHLTSPRGNTDQRPRVARRRAHDSRTAQNAGIRRRYEQGARFAARFPFVQVEVWGR